MNGYNDNSVVCQDCGREINPFVFSEVEDAWVKNGVASFQFKCDCGKSHILERPWGKK